MRLRQKEVSQHNQRLLLELAEEQQEQGERDAARSSENDENADHESRHVDRDLNKRGAAEAAPVVPATGGGRSCG